MEYIITERKAKECFGRVPARGMYLHKRLFRVWEGCDRGEAGIVADVRAGSVRETEHERILRRFKAIQVLDLTEVMLQG